MTDIIDQAQALQEIHIADAITKAKSANNHLKKGKCNYCQEPIDNYFCDDDCREDYEREQQIRKRQQGG